jgi:tRNA (cytidine/uridine-2'-O-)-methyltransferase
MRSNDPAPALLRVVLHSPRIPHNAAQIARTCYVMDLALHLIRPLGFRLDAAALRRAGVGYWDLLQPVVHDDETAFWRAAGDPERVFLLSRRGGRPLTEAGFRAGDWLALGNEEEGLPASWIEARPDRTLAIPMRRDDARCLNLASAASMAIFEAMRQIGAFDRASQCGRSEREA